MELNKETSIGYALTTTLNLLRKHFNKDLKNLGISTEQYSVLKIIYESGDLTPTKIAEILNRDKATITRIIKSLEKKELIEKENINNRSFNIKLTKSAYNLIKQADEIAISYHNKILNSVGEKNITHMLEILKKIREIFKGNE